MRFLTDDFLLRGETAKRLYHDFAETLPIIDYHCHINAREIAEDVTFQNITNVWLDNDHYKWTAMRCCGIEERYITGDASPYEKFKAYARILPQCIGNPLHHWSHLELKKYFDFTGHLTEETAPEVWELTNKKLQETLSAREFMRLAKVELICTTDDPIDELQWHRRLRDEDFEIKVLPAFRPDKALDIEKTDFPDYLLQLSKVTGLEINNLDRLQQALSKRMDYFASFGCKLSDHALTRPVFNPCTPRQADEIIAKKLSGQSIGNAEEEMYKTYLLCWLGKEYAERDWVMQLHMGVLRDINNTLYNQIGVDAGGDAIGGFCGMDKLALFLGWLEAANSLPKMILYSINPNDNAAIGSIAGCFQTSQAVGKIQHGSAWWFNDTKIGMEDHLKTLASLGSLGSFIGMLTDSRSFLSYTRHEYFRRILCNYLGELVDNGEYPLDLKLLGEIVENICYYNSKRYFDFK
jgi:glucuronate isomerase